MAEAFGIAGSAVGIVSLGLQLYGGISTYFDALESREDDLASARAQLDSLKVSLMTIQPVLTLSSITSTGSSAIPPIVGQCMDELSQLDTLLQELAGSSSSCKELKRRGKKMKFPFRRDSLMKLEDRLHKTNGVFQTALSVFHLNKSLSNEQKLAIVEAATTQIPAISTNLVRVTTDSQNIKADIRQISNEMNNVVTISRSNNNAVTSLADNFEAFAPDVISRLGEVRQNLGAVARQDDIRELSRVSMNNTDILCRVDVSVAHMAATTENKLGLIESSTQSLASADQKILQKLSNLEQLLGLQGMEHQMNSQFALQRVFAKPSQTRELLDSISPVRVPKSHHNSSFQEGYGWPVISEVQGPSCTCVRRRSCQGTSRNFGPFWLRTETSYHGHGQTCQLSKWNLGRKSRWFELTAARKSSFCSWAVAVSLAIATGAGGLSISPNIQYRPVVDEERSPVFQLLSILDVFLRGWQSIEPSRAEVSRCLNATADMMLMLYQDKKAFPYEVNERGESAIYKMSRMVRQVSFRWRAVYSEFVLRAVQSDMPANICDFSGRTPVMELALSRRHDKEEIMPLLSILYTRTPEPLINSAMLSNWDTFEKNFFIKQSLDSLLWPRRDLCEFRRVQADIFGYGPICTAISTRYRKEQIPDLINAMNVCELSSFGQTPLHMAAGAGDIDALAALLRSPHALDKLHLQDVKGDHAIDYAVHNSAMCYYGDRVFCSNCCCSDALGTLLCVEGCFDGYLEGSMDTRRFTKALQSGSLRSSLLLLGELKLKRDQLKQLALTHLGNEDTQRYKLDHDDVLDYYGNDVVECLTNMGIRVPMAVQNSFFKSARQRSIYHNIPPGWEGWASDGLEPVVQLMFDLGFHDVDEPNEMGHTPLMLVCKGGIGPAVTLWFVEHGADLTLRVPCPGREYYDTHVHPTVAQQIFDGKLGWWVSSPGFQSSERASLLARVGPVETSDDCECYCSEGGCSPASIMFHEIWKAYDRGKKGYPPKTPTEIGAAILGVLERDALNLTSHQPVCLKGLRMLTFEALGITHTCGCGRRIHSNRDEIVEIWDEEAFLIERLERLLRELAAKFDTSGMSLSTFIATEWVPCLRDVLRELDGDQLSEAERRGAEAMGVKWQAHAENRPSNKWDMSAEDFLHRTREIERG